MTEIHASLLLPWGRISGDDPREIKHSFHSALLVDRCQLESQRPSTTVPSASCVGSSSSTAAGGFGSSSSLLRSFTPGRGHETEEKPADVAVGQWRIKTWEQSCGRGQTTLWPGPPQLQSWVWSAKMFKHTHCAWSIIVILCGFNLIDSQQSGLWKNLYLERSFFSRKMKVLCFQPDLRQLHLALR